MCSLYRLLFMVAALFLLADYKPAAVQDQPPSTPSRYSYDQLVAHLDSDSRATLAATNEVLVFHTDAATLSLLPAPIAALIDETALPARGLVVEGLFHIPLTAQQLPYTTPLLIYNVTRAISTLTGLEYYSHSRKRYRTLYEQSYVVDTPETLNRLADPIVTSIPDRDTQYIWQQDSSFGENAYRALYQHRDGISTMALINLDTIHYAIFPLVEKEQMHLFFATIPTAEGVLFYNASFVAVDSFFGLENRVVNSFTSRIQAVGRWFSQMLFDSINRLS